MRLAVFFCILSFLVPGCAPPTRQVSAPSDTAVETRAQEYLAAGNYTAAAEEYIRLSEKNKKNTDTLLLQAAAAYLSGNNPELANNTLARVKEKIGRAHV